MTIAVGVMLGAFAASVSVLAVLWVLSSTNPAAHLSLPLPELAAVIGGCIGIALAASLLPAKLALRARPLEAGTNRE